MSKKFSATMDDLQTAMFSAGQKLNEITGYSDIEALKNSIEQQGIFPSFFSKFSLNRLPPNFVPFRFFFKLPLAAQLLFR